MSDMSLPAPPSADLLRRLRGAITPWSVAALMLVLLVLAARDQAVQSAAFTGDALLGVAPFLLLSVGVAAWAGATGADALIARAFAGAPLPMIALAALAGGLSPFCSCGVIPLIAALLAMGVPLAPVMAFWLASPVMDPSMFVMTMGVLDLDFAVAKTLAAVGLGLFGGLVTHLLARGGALANPLRDGVGNGGCGAASVRAPKPVMWRFWADPVRRARFAHEGWKSARFLGGWLTLAFVLESLMLAYIPAQSITAMLGGSGLGPIAVATLVGVPAYLNGYAALPLVGGLIDQGMSPGAGLAFLVAGGVTSIPAAVAVWALAKPRVFALYIALSLTGAFAAGLLFQGWIGT
ncbi:MAG: uncharacterized membrane protein YraQ (UPF0718 family) [Paracoccaceae bacterium]|jgi:uncharacterized membrane protein YraQ (UPF0718 family)